MTHQIPASMHSLPIAYLQLVSSEANHAYRFAETGTTIWRFYSLVEGNNYLFRQVDVDGKVVETHDTLSAFDIGEIHADCEIDVSAMTFKKCFSVAESEDGDLLFINGIDHNSIWIFRHDERSAERIANSFAEWLAAATSCYGEVAPSDLSTPDLAGIVGVWKAIRSSVLPEQVIKRLPILEITIHGKWVETWPTSTDEGTITVETKTPLRIKVGVRKYIDNYRVERVTQMSLVLIGPDAEHPVEYHRVK